ncbi:unnamed protein product [Linum trigynum]|uniref:Uncharacterized protein n=1 Tax=Linum trigynum TaxID=586398 RepID=A0AAV2DB63_9ROSI
MQDCLWTFVAEGAMRRASKMSLRPFLVGEQTSANRHHRKRFSGAGPRQCHTHRQSTFDYMSSHEAAMA